jgi:tetratricopeptide (TPR) repeat protein
VTAYNLGDAARICKVSPARLRYWERTALLERSQRVDSRPAFGFRDLLSVKKVRALLDSGVPLRRLRRIMRDLRERVPEIERPLGALSVWHEGSERVVLRHEGVLIEPNGQTVLDFANASMVQAPVASLEPRRSAGIADRQRALACFERGCELDSDRATEADAIEAYEQALRADPEFADAHCNLGSVYYNQDRRAAARACFERALGIEPRHLEARLNLATLLEEEGRDESALRHYKIALAVAPLQPGTHVSLALLYEKLGLPRHARAYWRRYLQIDPAGTWADLARRRLSD